MARNINPNQVPLPIEALEIRKLWANARWRRAWYLQSIFIPPEEGGLIQPLLTHHNLSIAHEGGEE